jgi:hypothetical protein
MTCHENPDQHLANLNARARLMRQAAEHMRSDLLAEHLRETAAQLATKAMMLVVEEGEVRTG